MMQLSQVSQAVNGDLVGLSAALDGHAILDGIAINTRADCDNRLFIALKGDNFDAHEFVAQAEQAGASAVMLERVVETNLPAVMVESTHEALLNLAAWWRSQFVVPVIGVTGSVGKTTVKEMLGAIFSQVGKGVVTEGNLNNEIGVPLTLMRLGGDDLYAIIEMGMNHAGEISRITGVAKPTIALINNAAAAHLEGLGTIEAVAQAKGEIFEGLSPDGVAIINRDDVFAPDWLDLVGSRRVISFALKADADVSADYTVSKKALLMRVRAFGDDFDLQLNTVGEHNVRNALAAIAVAVAANIPVDRIKAGLENYRPLPGRLNLSRVGGLTLIDDTYNANPASMRAAIEVLVQYPDHCLIVGDMAELGTATEYEHRRLGEVAAELGIKKLLACGKYANLVVQAFDQDAVAFADQSKLVRYATRNLTTGTVLVKGSRSAKMEKVIAALSNDNVCTNASFNKNSEKDNSTGIENNNNTSAPSRGDH